MRSDWFLLALITFLTDDSLQFADKSQQQSHAVAEKPHDAIVKFDMYQNLQQHRTVLSAIAWLSYYTPCVWAITNGEMMDSFIHSFIHFCKISR